MIVTVNIRCNNGICFICDRHNGNILIHLSGHIIHIDYGFILGMSPGGVNFEGAPFKFTKEYLDVMGGQDSEYFSYFKTLFVHGLLEARCTCLLFHFYKYCLHVAPS